MTYSTHPAETHRSDAGAHFVVWALSLLGIIAAAMGSWIAIAPEDGTLTLYDRTWAVTEIADFWAPFLLIAGGAVAAISMTVSAVRDGQHSASRWLIAVEVLIALAGVAAVVAGIALAI